MDSRLRNLNNLKVTIGSREVIYDGNDSGD
jgi:hypothetical protein